MTMLVPPPTAVEVLVVRALLANGNEPAGDDQVIAGLVADLRNGRRFVVAPTREEVDAIRRVFPRAPVIVRPDAPRSRFAAPELVRNATPPACRRCELEAAGEDPDADGAGPTHIVEGECRIRWACGGCQHPHASSELDALGNRCRICGFSFAFTGVVIPGGCLQ